ncbi:MULTISPECIES: PHP domain-containing protein [Dictyoglomus]|uniref:PHP domain protein n=1 Tax=Dictyoglomus turgidum (strain DSM 6724 / Z-1310) TaxID=515635 RepID=B8E168_DICTD|nr:MULTISPECIES: PHP domain-containing protein [Dictyoglomus]ACK42196.1 PHP domain protein [Dictyoglomus turgidum DSM 6724]PNV80260.1 MAG: histidinol-phosphatase [Dictyoglomus turgidum]HBU32426.1 PHP domain-containing protein [Dictyoglomus sp.]
MTWIGVDLHIHTILSPCGDWNMSPKKIVEKAKEIGLGIIGITDHHMVENFPAVSYWGEKMDILVIPGMEIQTREEVHVLGLFKNYSSAYEFQKEIWNHLPDKKNDENLFGVQVVVNEKDEVERIEERLLLTSTNLSLEGVTKLIRKFDGFIILAHIDKPNFSVLSNLGFIPENLDYDLLELSKEVKIEKFLRDNYGLISKKNNFIISSDAHYLDDIKKPRTFIGVEGLTIEDVFFSLKNKIIKIEEMEV